MASGGGSGGSAAARAGTSAQYDERVLTPLPPIAPLEAARGDRAGTRSVLAESPARRSSDGSRRPRVEGVSGQSLEGPSFRPPPPTAAVHTNISDRRAFRKSQDRSTG